MKMMIYPKDILNDMFPSLGDEDESNKSKELDEYAINDTVQLKKEEIENLSTKLINFLKKDNITSNSNSNQSQNEDDKINLIPKNCNNTIPKIATCDMKSHRKSSKLESNTKIELPNKAETFTICPIKICLREKRKIIL